jgi:hypothetical protein
MLTVGIKVLFGGGSVGLGPVPADTGNRAISPQAHSAAAATSTKNRWACIICDPLTRCGLLV